MGLIIFISQFFIRTENTHIHTFVVSTIPPKFSGHSVNLISTPCPDTHLVCSSQRGKSWIFMIIPGLWMVGIKSREPSKPSQRVRQRNTSDRVIAKIQTVIFRTSLELEYTKNHPQAIKVMGLSLCRQEITKNCMFTNKGGKVPSQRFQVQNPTS